MTETWGADTAAADVGPVPLELLLEAQADGVVLVDAEGVVRYLNAAGQRLLGRTADVVVGRNVFPAAGDSDELSAFLRPARGIGVPITWRSRVDRGARSLTATAAPVGTLLLISFRQAGGGSAQPPVVVPADGGAPGEWTERERLAFLAEVTETMIGTLHTGESVTRLAELVVPRLCDWAVVTVQGDDGRPGEEGRAHRDPALRGDVDTYRDGRIPVISPTTPMVVALRTGEPVQLASLDEPTIATTLPTEPVRAAWRRLDTTSATVIPLRAHGETFGTLAMMNSGDRPPHSSAEVAMAVEVARRGALALDNSRLYGRQLDAAATLQRSLLTPPTGIDAADLEVAVRYRPASRHQAVGGDWYDAFGLPDGVTLLVIGDVIGHNVEASAAMGQIRSMLRALAHDQPGSPAHILDRLDRVLTGLRVDTMATALLGRLEPPTDRSRQAPSILRWCSAGHIPPLLLGADRHVRVLTTPPERLLGAGWTGGRADHEVALGPGDGVLFVTDGIIEHGRCDIDEGLSRLTALLAESADRPVEQLCDEILDHIVAGRADDDIALLALRRRR